MDDPAVSVCIPTYNYANFLPRAIESILGQTHRDLELIVVDDASTDNTDEVVEQYKSDPRFRYLKNDPNLGLFANFNYCATLARGEYLKFLCADDWLAPEFVAETLALLKAHPNVGLVTNSHVLVTEEEQPRTIEYAPFDGRDVIDREDAVDQLIDWHYVIGRPTNVLLRKEIFQDVGGFDAAFSPTGDLQLWLKILQNHDLGAVREPRCFVRSHSSKTHDFADDPTEAVFRVWEAAAERPGALVTPPRLKRALNREATRCTVFAIDAALHGHFDHAKKVWGYTRRHISLPRFIPAFLASTPRIARNFATRMVATRTGRYLLIDPTARLGPPL
ncbi:MAG: glycosyltransferase family 2 protein [Solirubrobacterales bacterium]